jgi:hypothetical protein
MPERAPGTCRVARQVRAVAIATVIVERLTESLRPSDDEEVLQRLSVGSLPPKEKNIGGMLRLGATLQPQYSPKEKAALRCSPVQRRAFSCP